MGVVGLLEVSRTVTVHFEAWFTTTLVGAHVTLVVVEAGLAPILNLYVIDCAQLRGRIVALL